MGKKFEHTFICVAEKIILYFINLIVKLFLKSNKLLIYVVFFIMFF